jgi:phage-related protein
MTYPTFNITYNYAYSTSIEFMTQINEKMKGREQRYPQWTYPKRTFTLTFEKTPAKREELEAFFIDVMGQAGKFYWTWNASNGGDDKTYECTFDSDDFKQQVYDLGFSKAKLNLVCIDNNPVEDVAELDFYHKAECDFNISFYTVLDKIFTAQNNRKSYWDSPKKSWTLSFEKTPEVRKQLEAFFIAKRGKFRSFEWTWATDRGGDGQTYIVRFDIDSLDIDILDSGYGTFQLKLKEVFPTPNPLLEVEKDEIIPRKLLKIELEGGSIYVLDNETLEELNYNGEMYLGAPLSHGEIKKDDNSSVSKLEISLSNVGLAISGIIGQRGDVITGSPAVLTLVFLNINTNEMIPDLKDILWSGYCNNLKLDYETATMDVETALGGYEKQAPVIRYRPTCQVRRFKDIRCGYIGSETSCDRTFATCKALGNQGNFAGFPSVVVETTIKAASR